MYRFSRALFLEIKDLVDPHPDTSRPRGATHRADRVRGDRRAARARSTLLHAPDAQPVRRDPPPLPALAARTRVLRDRAHARARARCTSSRSTPARTRRTPAAVRRRARATRASGRRCRAASTARRTRISRSRCPSARLPDGSRSARRARRPRRRLLTARGGGALPHVLAHADAGDLLALIPAGAIDLVYLDPPFGTGIARTGRARRWLRRRPARRASTATSRGCADVLAECHRVLRPSGSLFLHLDWRASHRARVVLDELFGEQCFRNEIIWHYGLGGGAPRDAFARKHDTILFYARSRDAVFHAERGPVTAAMAAKYAHVDELGRRYQNAHGRRYYLQGGKRLDDVWELPALAPTARERVGWPTQKPLAAARADRARARATRRLRARPVLRLGHGARRRRACSGGARSAAIARARRSSSRPHGLHGLTATAQERRLVAR